MLNLNLHIPYFDDMDFYSFQWKYDRLVQHFEQIKSKNSNVADGSRFT